MPLPCISFITGQKTVDLYPHKSLRDEAHSACIWLGLLRKGFSLPVSKPLQTELMHNGGGGKFDSKRALVPQTNKKVRIDAEMQSAVCLSDEPQICGALEMQSRGGTNIMLRCQEESLQSVAKAEKCSLFSLWCHRQSNGLFWSVFCAGMFSYSSYY